MISYKEVIKTNFSRHAERYGKYSFVRADMLSRLLGLLEKSDPEDILEIGCGTGAYTGILRGAFPRARISCVDISVEMLRVAQRDVQGEAVEFIQGDIEKLSLDTGKFDIITSNAALQWLEDLDGCLKRFRDSLRGKGRIAYSIYGPKTFYELQQVFEAVTGKKNILSASKFTGGDEIYGLMKKYYGSVEISEERHTSGFISLLDLLRDIHCSGTRGTGLSGGVVMKKGMIECLEKKYLEMFGAVKATHQVYMVSGEKI